MGIGQAGLVWQNILNGERLIWVMNKGRPISAIVLPTLSPEWKIVDH